jgi:LytS/YehU family sensor histidine kinase
VGVHPNSLQLLAENAIKHNTFKKDDPLLVEVYEEAEFICVKNSLRVKNLLTPTTKIGLENIKNRYALHDNLRVIVESDTHFFTVKLPKIDIQTR